MRPKEFSIQLSLTNMLAPAFVGVALVISTRSAMAFDPPTALGAIEPVRGVQSATGLPGAILTAGNKLIFASDRDASVGVEVFITDLATNTTTLLKDIVLGSESSSPSEFRPFGANKVVFTAQTTSHGRELWITDGTVGGTVMAADVNLGTPGSNPANVRTNTVSGVSYAVFTASRAGQGNELAIYRESDGALLFVDINAGAGDSDPGELYLHPTTAIALFSAQTSTTGREPYRVNFSGSSPVLSLLADVFPGPESSMPANFHYLPAFNEAYYSAYSPTTGIEPYVNATILGNLNSGTMSSNPVCFVNSGGAEYFIGESSSTYYLYGFAGSFPPTAITALPDVVYRGSCALINNGSAKLLFSTTTGAAGSELWVSNFTSSGTIQLKDINAGSGSSNPFWLTTVGTSPNQRAIFGAYDSANGQEMWSTDGTAAGTTLLINANSGSQGSAPQLFAHGSNTAIFLSVTSNTEPYLSLFRSNGTTDTTVLLENFSDRTTTFSDYAISYLGAVGDKLIYSASSNASYGREPFITDGTRAGTRILKDLSPGSQSSSLYESTLSINDNLIFVAAGGGNFFDLEPWVTDGTEAGTVKLLDIGPGNIGSDPVLLGVMNGFAFFTAETANSRQLFKTDGTPAGTSRAFTAPAGFFGSYGLVAGNQLYMQCDPNNQFLFELCKSDGTLAGTSLVKDIDGLAGVSSSPDNFMTAGDRLVFLANDGVNGYRVWGSDGTSAGTVLLGDLEPGDEMLRLSVEAGGKRFLPLRSSAHGQELWRTDGTVAGTIRLTDLNPGPADTDLFASAAHDGKVFFSARGIDGQLELYSSDGTAAGTRLFIDPDPSKSLNPSDLQSVAGFLLFTGETTTTGREVFYFQGSDPSTLSTLYVNGTYTGRSYPAYLKGVGGKLYFQAFNTSSKYTEMYRLTVDACPGDAGKLVAGVCGCGVPDEDSDLDGTFNCLDACQADPAKIAAGACGCGVADTDRDSNGQLDCRDDRVISEVPGKPFVRRNSRRGELVFTVPNVTGVKYLFTIAKLKSKNGPVVGSRKFETSTFVTKRKLSTLQVKGRRLSGWISVSYRLKIGSRLSPSSGTAQLRIR